MKLKYLSLSICCSLLLGVMPIFVFGSPSILFPLPIYMVLVRSIEVNVLQCLVLVGLSFFFFLNTKPRAFRLRTLAVNSILTLGSLAWFLISKDYGVRHQGLIHFLIAVLLSMLGLSLLWWLSRSSDSKNRYLYSLALPVFMVWLAFPYFGELI